MALRAASIGALLLPLLVGCSIDNSGLLAARVTPATGAVVVDVYYLGAVLRTLEYDPGASVGFSRRSYIFAEELRGLPEPGWHWLHVPLPEDGPVALAAQSYGLDGGYLGGETSGAVGYQAVTVLAMVAATESVAYRLAYAADDPAATILDDCEGVAGC